MAHLEQLTNLSIVHRDGTQVLPSPDTHQFRREGYETDQRRPRFTAPATPRICAPLHQCAAAKSPAGEHLRELRAPRARPVAYPLR
jgi:hypothetical protein